MLNAPKHFSRGAAQKSWCETAIATNIINRETDRLLYWFMVSIATSEPWSQSRKTWCGKGLQLRCSMRLRTERQSGRQPIPSKFATSSVKSANDSARFTRSSGIPLEEHGHCTHGTTTFAPRHLFRYRRLQRIDSSVVTANPAIEGHLKTGHRAAGQDLRLLYRAGGRRGKEFFGFRSWSRLVGLRATDEAAASPRPGAPFPSSQLLFGTEGICQGRAVFARLANP